MLKTRDANELLDALRPDLAGLPVDLQAIQSAPLKPKVVMDSNLLLKRRLEGDGARS